MCGGRLKSWCKLPQRQKKHIRTKRSKSWEKHRNLNKLCTRLLFVKQRGKKYKPQIKTKEELCRASLPNSTSWSSVMMRMMLGRMFLRSLWMRPLRPWALVVVKAQLPETQSSDRRANQDSQWVTMVTETTGQWMGKSGGGGSGLMEKRTSQATRSHLCSTRSRSGLWGDERGNVCRHYSNKHGEAWN